MVPILVDPKTKAVFHHQIEPMAIGKLLVSTTLDRGGHLLCSEGHRFVGLEARQSRFGCTVVTRIYCLRVSITSPKTKHSERSRKPYVMLVLSLFGPCCPGIRINDTGGHEGRPYYSAAMRTSGAAARASAST